jgi:aminoglycoside 3-N-acetyltransferase
VSEREVVDRTAIPGTVDSLARNLSSLGVEPGMTLLVHTSLSALGWVCGGAVAVIEALLRALGPMGTLVMPTHTGGLTDPADWCNPPVPEAWKPLIRAAMPAYDPATSPTRQMGAVAEVFRIWPGTIRSAHPSMSFAAHGPNAEQIVNEHALDFGLGETSPLGRLYDLHGSVLLLGVGYDRNTSMHLAEYRAEAANRREKVTGVPVFVGGVRVWRSMRDIEIHSGDFGRIGEDFERETGLARRGPVGAGEGVLMPQRELVDFTAAWISKHRFEGSTAESVAIRRIQTGDRPAWAGLRCALWPGHDSSALDVEMDDILSHPENQTVFVAIATDGSLVGMIEASLRPQAEGCRTSPVGYLEGWYVVPNQRRHGIGRRLVEAAERWALSQGCREMASDTTDEYPLSPAAHRAVGYSFVRTRFEFRKDLVSDRSSRA